MFKFNDIILPFLIPSIVSGSAGFLRGNNDNRSLVALTETENFASFNTGDVVTTLPGGVTVTTLKKKGAGAFVEGEAMIFDSANPTGGDFDLGTPHEDFGGPGVGDAGAKGSPWENSIAHGNVLIISEDGDSSDPDDNHKGGVLTFDFPEPQPIDSIGLLDDEKRTKFTVITSDGTKTKIDRKNAGDNGYELVSIGKSNVVSLVVTFYGSAAITEINYAPVPPKCRTIDFEGFKAGDVVSDLGYGASVLAVKRNKKKGPLAWGEAMIFDSSNPTGDDFDLGTPNQDFGGPGIGKAGEMGKPNENSIAHGKVLIVSEDEDSSDPDDNKFGGKLLFHFSEPHVVESIGILDTEKPTTFEIIKSNNDKTTIINEKGGDNSFELVPIEQKSVVKLIVSFPDSIAITELNLCLDDAPSTVPSTVPSSVPSTMPSAVPSHMPSDTPSDRPSAAPTCH